MNWAHMAHTIITLKGRFMVHILSSSIGIITHDIININIWIGLKQWIKSHSPYYFSHIHGKQLLQQKSLFTQNNNNSPYLHKMTTKPKVCHLIFGLWSKLISLSGNFGSRGLEGQEVCSVKLQQFKVDKENTLLGVSSPTPRILTSQCVAGNIWKASLIT